MSNKKAGNDFEQEFCRLLAEAGFWVHNMANRKNGQPADVIAAKNGHAYLIDCKDCQRDIFEFSRVEENQRLAMRRWEDCGNGRGLFALKMSTGIYLLTLRDIEELELHSKSMPLSFMERYFFTLEHWRDAGHDL